MDHTDLREGQGWETKTMLRLFRFKSHKEETWVNYHIGTYNMARKIWIQMGLPFLYEVIVESMWMKNPMQWLTPSKKVYRWRSTRWWLSLQTEMMECDDEKSYHKMEAQVGMAHS